MAMIVSLLVLALLLRVAADPAFTVFVNAKARAGGDGSAARPFVLIKDAVTAGLNQPPTTSTWTIRLQEGVYAGAGQVGIAIRDTKRYIIWFENRGVQVECDRSEFFIDFTGLGGRGALEVTGNGGSIANCVDSAIRSRRQTYISSVMFLHNRALLQGSALRVQATDPAVDLRVEECVFEGQLQRPLDAPSSQSHEGGGAVWASGLASVRITGCMFSGNEASQGGAVYLHNAGSVSIGWSTFRGNTALLDSVGGGGLAIVSDAAIAVSIWDTSFERNNAGGLAAGMYLGGWIRLNLTRVSVVNNTSSKAASCESCDKGVGIVLWKKVQGFAVNSSLLSNTLDARPGVARNLACTGPLFARSCVLRWNDACDVCGRDLSSAELPLTPRIAPCLLSVDVWNSAWFLYGSLVAAIVLAMSVIACGGVWVWRRYRKRDAYVKMRNAAAIAGDHDASDGGDGNRDDGVGSDGGGDNGESSDMDGAVPMHELGRGPGGQRMSGDAMADLDDVALDAHAGLSDDGGGIDGMGDARDDDDDDDTRALAALSLEPPGYGKPLPSSDFVRHSPMMLGTFKEIDYDELDLDPEPIGSGAFGLVYRASWRGSVVAVKKYIGALDAQGVKEFRAEAQLLHGVGNHPNVIKLFGACTQGPNYCLVLPYFQRGNLRAYFRAMPEEKRTWAFVRALALQIVAGMIHLHRENIVHRDLAARNILVDDNDSVRITDFGLARFVQNSVSANTNSNIGAVAWMSPEAVTKRRYSAKSDVWSFGCTLWEMCTGELPYSGMEPIHVAVQIAKGATLAVPDYVPADLAAVMRSCWAANPADRPSFDELYARLSTGAAPKAAPTVSVQAAAVLAVMPAVDQRAASPPSSTSNSNNLASSGSPSRGNSLRSTPEPRSSSRRGSSSVRQSPIHDDVRVSPAPRQSQSPRSLRGSRDTALRKSREEGSGSMRQHGRKSSGAGRK